MFDYFVSHSSLDKDSITDKLVMKIRNKGYSIWYDKEQITSGDNINKEVANGLENSFCLLLIVTKNFLNSKWVYFEAGQFSKYEKLKIVPIIYDISTDEYLEIIQILGNIKYINGKEKTNDEIIECLIDALNKAKSENDLITTEDNLFKLYKIVNKYENIQSNIVALELKEYFDILDTHIDFAFLSAKKIALSIAKDYQRFYGVKEKSITENTDEISAFLEKHASLNIIEYFKYILGLNNTSLIENDVILINRALYAIVQWYLNIKFSSKLKKFDFEILFPGEMTHSDFDETDEIDYLVLREDLIASIETAIEWYDYNEYTYIAIRDKGTKKIAGYFTLLPITQDTYNLILSGDFMDKEFTTDSILTYDAPGLYILYVASVAIHPYYKNSNAFIELYNAVIDVLLSLATEREIYISEIIAEASTKQGEKFCKIMGMKKYCSTTTNTDVYTLTLIPPELKLFGEKGKLFTNMCKQKYEEYREFFNN